MSDFLGAEPFLIRAFTAGLAVAIIAGSLGCFIVWRKAAYFGDALSHAALLGAPLGFLLGLDYNYGMLAICVLFACALAYIQKKRLLSNDTALGILAHSALSFGLLAISLLQIPNFDLHAYLFGDILTVDYKDLYIIGIGGAFILSILYIFGEDLILMIVNEDLAKAEGVKTDALHLLIALLTGVAIAISVRIVGVLLITALLIIPAATARSFSGSPLGMALNAILFGISAVIFGMLASLYLDTPSGPSIVAAASILFALSFPVSALSAHK